MHEVGIARSIIEIAEQNAREQGAFRVVSVTVAIGELSGVVADAVDFCFEACARGTMLEGTRLIIERIAGLGRCLDCQSELQLDPYTIACAQCGGFALEAMQGKELKIIEMEVD